MPGCRNCKREFSSVKAWEYHDCVSVEQQQAQLITRLTEALGDLVCNDCHVGIRNDTAVARAYTRDCRGCRPVRIVLAAVAKERAL